ncbi:hypothetical protein V1499_13260 [Neobacillus sp. SCS-31]|uniref:hypothetical protein n=1 Tax=Neobacillus oceani TaxID=3115292 RepID=UPI003906D55D
MTSSSKVRKSLSITLVVLMACFSLLSSVAFGAESSQSKKEKPFPSQSNSRLSLNNLALNNGNFGNESVQALVGADGRFNAGLKELNSENWYNIIYSWPSEPWSSYTTVKVDGEDLVYGNNPDGQFMQPPSNNNDNTANESVWKANDISVKQVLQPAVNPATGQPDALQIRYIITNTGDAPHDVGLRIMLDTMVNRNDSAPFKVPSNDGIESIDYEKDYVGTNVPDFWQVFNDFNNPDISAQYTMRGGNATVPDRFAIANWGGLSGSKWDYIVSDNSYTGDSGVGMWWNPKTLAPGEQKIITTYFGRPGVGGKETLVLSGKKRLTFEEWSSSPFNLISYFTNTTQSNLNNVRLELTSGPGIRLVDSDPEVILGSVGSGMTKQSTWKIQPTVAGNHQITVKAFAEGKNEPIATATYEVEALEPVVPTNITLGGSNGVTTDGIPVSGRMSPLTVNAAFNDPQAVGVTLTAVDADGKEYSAEMSSGNKINWTHTFVPYEKGLWGSPMTITVVPRYQDNSTGTPLNFQIVLIDPSGYIYNSEKGEEWRLPGATVTLQYYDPLLETWVYMTDEAYPGRLSPITNPQVTGADGRYAWDTAAGDYRVLVSRPGFENAISRVVTVPPEVTDLHVGMIPTDRQAPSLVSSGVEEGGAYTEGVSIGFTTTDDEAGVRNVTYKIDDNDAVTINSDNANLPKIESPGSHKVIISAVDYAGNIATKEINFTINDNDEEPVSIMAVINAAIEKSELAKTDMQAALDRFNTNATKAEVQGHINIAKDANSQAKEKITVLKALLGSYEFKKMPLFLQEVLKTQAVAAEIQASTVNTKLEKTIEFLANGDASKFKGRLKEAQSANSSSLASLKFIKGNLITFENEKE